MAIEWFKRLLESEEEKEKRIIQQYATSDDFKQSVKEAASSLVKEAEEARKREEQEQVEEEKRKLEESIKHVERVADSMKESNEPFINILGMGFSKENGLEVKLDYNDAFIRYLNAAGIQASNDEETVRLWLAHLNYDIEQEMLAQDYLRNGVSSEEKPSMTFDEYFPEDDDDEIEDEDEPDTGWK